ncbi:hypothetical protein Y032_0141g2215 [Ancylostoma ceylanicum]|uniref:Uncharacterized protein n=1 Tax=Ancylostoma ceylanicum TaxID=53326 RepID=A0A016T3S5_9BILA|nr:hypothetical protein Y032_0141g2215 [Ancylostoma ceylanicum]
MRVSGYFLTNSQDFLRIQDRSCALPPASTVSIYSSPYRLGPFDRYSGGLACQHPPDQYGIDSTDPSGYQSLSSFSVDGWRSLRILTTATGPILFVAIRLDTSHSILLLPLPVAFLLGTSHFLYLFFCVAIPLDTSHNPF